MFQTFQNSAEIVFTLVPDGPILVRAQSVGIDPGVADMEFQRTCREGRPTVFLAGSGLKGVVRSHCERLLRSAGKFACDPTHTKDQATCGKLKLGAPDAERPHAGQCPACFTFGSFKLAGRFRVADAYPRKDLWELTNQTEVRIGVGIDRKSQAASGGVLYDTEVVVAGGFETKLTGESFTLWQLGLVLQALADLDAGFVRIGGNKARGMGNVRVTDLRVTMSSLDRRKGFLCGARKDGRAQHDYGLPERDEIQAPEGASEATVGLFRVVTYEGASVASLRDRLVQQSLRPYLGLAG